MAKRRGGSIAAYEMMIIVLLFVMQAAFQSQITPLGVVDEALALLFMPSFCLWYIRKGHRLKVNRSLIFFLVFLGIFWIFGWISTAVNHYQPMTNVLKDAYANLKFFFAMGLGYTMFDRCRKEPLENRRGRTVFWIVLNLVIFVMFAAMVADQIFHISDGETRWVTQVWCSSLTYESYSFLVANAIFLVAVVMRFYEYYDRAILIPLIELLYVIYGTRRVKGIVMTFVILVLYFIFLKKGEKKKILINLVLFFGGIGAAALAVFQMFYYYVALGTESARAVLAMGGPYLAKIYFPLGTGWATYGSAFSIHPYSEVYNITGMNVVWGLSEQYDMFISDTFWPMILGQTGVFGFLAYLAAFVILLSWVWKRRGKKPSLFVPIVLLILYILVMSTGESAFVSPMAVSMGFWIGCMMSETDRRKTKIYRSLDGALADAKDSSVKPVQRYQGADDFNIDWTFDEEPGENPRVTKKYGRGEHGR